MRGVEEIIFQTLVMGRIYALRRARAAEPLKPDERRYHPRRPAWSLEASLFFPPKFLMI
jgi:hypothetical protein